MSVLFGLYQPEEGEIHKDGKVVSIKNPNDANALGIGMVHQHFKLVECFTVLDNIIMGVEPTKHGFLQKGEAREEGARPVGEIRPARRPRRAASRTSPSVCSSAPRSSRCSTATTRSSSSTSRPPCSPRRRSSELMQIMREPRGRGQVASSSSPTSCSEIMAVADRCTVLRKGKCIGTVETTNTTAGGAVGHDGRPQRQFPRGEKARARRARWCSTCEHLTVASKAPQEQRRARTCRFKVRAGEIVCIAGIDGNGQTELVYGLTGLEPRRGRQDHCLAARTSPMRPSASAACWA